MGESIALAALVVGIVGAFGRLAYKSDERWPQFRLATTNAFNRILSASGWLAVGLLFAKLFPEYLWQMLATAVAIACGCVLLVLAIELAHWLRKP